jgi:hypothetical protein
MSVFIEIEEHTCFRVIWLSSAAGLARMQQATSYILFDGGASMSQSSLDHHRRDRHRRHHHHSHLPLITFSVFP